MRFLTDLSFLSVRSGAGPGSPAFDPAMLFAAGEDGFWLDPSDLSTLWLDTAGTQPATAPGQAVARVDDKSGNGRNATQATLSRRPVLARHPAGGRRNRLAYTEDLTQSAWSKDQGALATAPDSVYLPASTLPPASGGPRLAQAWFHSRPSGAAYTGRIVVPPASGWSDPTATLRISVAGGGSSQIDLSAQPEAQVVTIGHVGTGTGTWVLLAVNSSKNLTLTGLGAAQLEAGAAATPYQKVGSVYDVTEAGKADVWHLVFDGVDDHLAGAALNLTAVQAATLAAAFRPEGTAGTDTVLAHVADMGSAGGLSLNAIAGTGLRLGGRSTAGATGMAAVTVLPVPFDGATQVCVGRIDHAALAGAGVALRHGGLDLAQTDGLTQANSGTMGNGGWWLGGVGSSQPFAGAIHGVILRAVRCSDALLAPIETDLRARAGLPG